MTLSKIAAETKAGVVLICIICIAALVAWYRDPPPKLSSHYSTPPPLTATQDVPKDTLKNQTVRVLRKSELTKKTSLPVEVTKNPGKEITATAELPATRNGAEVVAVFDKETGDTTLMAKSKPIPLLAFETEKRIGLSYGLTAVMVQEAAVYGELHFFRVGNIYAGIRGEVNSRPEAKIMGTLEYRFPN